MPVESRSSPFEKIEENPRPTHTRTPVALGLTVDIWLAVTCPTVEVSKVYIYYFLARRQGRVFNSASQTQEFEWLGPGRDDETSLVLQSRYTFCNRICLTNLF